MMSRADSGTSPCAAAGADGERFITPSSALHRRATSNAAAAASQPAPSQSRSARGGATAASCSTGTSTHASATTEMDASHAPWPAASLDASTNTAALSYLHPHASVFATVATQHDHFMRVLQPPPHDTAAAVALPASPSSSSTSSCATAAASSSRATYLMTTLLSMHADRLLLSLQPTYLSSLAREQVFRHIQGLVFHLDPSLHLFSYGSVPLKTYLPGGDIDIGVVLSGRFAGGHAATAAQNFLLKLKTSIEAEAFRDKQAFVTATLAHQAAGGVGPPPDLMRSPFLLTHLTFVNAPEVKVLKLQYNHSLLIDISVNTTSALATVCWIEEMEREMVRAMVARDDQERRTGGGGQAGQADRLLEGKSFTFHHHLLKRSILLIKAWSTYESRTLASAHALLSTYALEILIIYVMQHFPSLCVSPLHVLYVFLAFYSRHWNWERHALSLGGPISLDQMAANSSGSNAASMLERAASEEHQEDTQSTQAKHHPAPLLDVDLLTKLCTKYARKTNSSSGNGNNASTAADVHSPFLNPLADEIDALVDARCISVSTSTSCSAGTTMPASMWSAASVPRQFALKHLNIVDPLDPANNLGKSVNFAAFLRIRACWRKGAHDLQQVFDQARQVGESIHQRERMGTEGDSHILQLLQSFQATPVHQPTPLATAPVATVATEATSFTRFPANGSSAVASPPVVAAVAAVAAEASPVHSSLHSFRELLSGFFRCTHRHLARPHRPDLTGFHADESMQVLTEGHHSPHEEAEEPLSGSSEDDSVPQQEGTPRHLSKKAHRQRVDTDGEQSDSALSSINSRTSSPLIHAVLNLGQGAIDRLARASSSFPSSAFTASSSLSLAGEMHMAALSGLSGGLMPVGSVSQPSSLPSSPPSTPPARSSLPPSPTLPPSAPFPTPMPPRSLSVKFSPSMHGRFRSPFRTAMVSSSPQLHRSLLTHSPSSKSFMLSPGVHGMAGGVGATMAMLPPSASASSSSASAIAAADMPILHSFLIPPSPVVTATSRGSPLPNVRAMEDDSAENSDVASSYTQAQSFPDTRGGASRRPFILSQLQEASSHQRNQTDSSSATSVTPSPISSPLIMVSSASPPMTSRRMPLLESKEAGNATSKYTNAETSVKPDGLTFGPSSTSSVVSGKLDANATPFTSSPMFTDDGTTGVEGGHGGMYESGMTNGQGMSDEGIMDPLYNDLTDLQHQYNLLRYLVTSFHGSGSHTHTHTRAQHHHAQQHHSSSPRVSPAEQQSVRSVERSERERDRERDRERERERELQREREREREQEPRKDKVLASKRERQQQRAASGGGSGAITGGATGGGDRPEKPQGKTAKLAWAKTQQQAQGGGGEKTQQGQQPNNGGQQRIQQRSQPLGAAHSHTPPPPFSTPQSPQLVSSGVNSQQLSRSSSPPMHPHGPGNQMPLIHITMSVDVKQQKKRANATAGGGGQQQGGAQSTSTSSTKHPPKHAHQANQQAHQATSASSHLSSDADDESTPMQSPLLDHPGAHVHHGHMQQQHPPLMTQPHMGMLMNQPQLPPFGPYPGQPKLPFPHPAGGVFPHPHMMPPPPAQQQPFNYPPPYPQGPGGPVQGPPFNVPRGGMYPAPGYPLAMEGNLNSFHHSLIQAPPPANRSFVPYPQQGPPQGGNTVPAGSRPPPQGYAPQNGYTQHGGPADMSQQTLYNPALQPIIVPNGPYVAQQMPMGGGPPPSSFANGPPGPPAAAPLSWAQNLAKFGGGGGGASAAGSGAGPKRSPMPSPVRPPTLSSAASSPAHPTSGAAPTKRANKPRDLFGSKAAAQAQAAPASAASTAPVTPAGSGGDDDGWETVTTEGKKKKPSGSPTTTTTTNERPPRPTSATAGGTSATASSSGAPGAASNGAKNANWRAAKDQPATPARVHTRPPSPATTVGATASAALAIVPPVAASAFESSSAAASAHSSPNSSSEPILPTSLWRAGAVQLKQALAATPTPGPATNNALNPSPEKQQPAQAAATTKP